MRRRHRSTPLSFCDVVYVCLCGRENETGPSVDGEPAQEEAAPLKTKVLVYAGKTSLQHKTDKDQSKVTCNCLLSSSQEQAHKAAMTNTF